MVPRDGDEGSDEGPPTSSSFTISITLERSFSLCCWQPLQHNALPRVREACRPHAGLKEVRDEVMEGGKRDSLNIAAVHACTAAMLKACTAAMLSTWSRARRKV